MVNLDPKVKTGTGSTRHGLVLKYYWEYSKLGNETLEEIHDRHLIYLRDKFRTLHSDVRATKEEQDTIISDSYVNEDLILGEDHLTINFNVFDYITYMSLVLDRSGVFTLKLHHYQGEMEGIEVELAYMSEEWLQSEREELGKTMATVETELLDMLPLIENVRAKLNQVRTDKGDYPLFKGIFNWMEGRHLDELNDLLHRQEELMNNRRGLEIRLGEVNERAKLGEFRKRFLTTLTTLDDLTIDFLENFLKIPRDQYRTEVVYLND